MVWWLDSPITHRGLHDNEKGIPENSMSAFSQSIAAKLPIELDVHLLKDGNIAVFHDDSLKRMTGIDSPIRDQTLSDIRRLRLFNTKESVPTLQEVLELVNGEVPLLIEIKNRDSVGTLERRLLEILKQYHGDYALESFNPFSMLWFKKESPDIDRGQLSGDFKDEDLAFHKKLLLRRLAFNRLVSPSFVAYDVRLLPFWRVSQLRKSGIPIIGWTVKTRHERERVARYCDNIIFEGGLSTIEGS